MVSQGKEIANVVDLSSIKVKLSIPEEEVAKLRARQVATLRIDSAPDKAFRGQVLSVGSKTETPTAHTYPVEVVVENKETNLLKAGMFGRVEIQALSVQKALTIARGSLVNEDSRPAVFVVENNIARLRPVTIGIRSGENIQVTQGLNEGDLIISFGQRKLKDGSPVQFRQK